MSLPADSNPLRILRTLDACLSRPFELIVCGRSALALGFPAAPAAFAATMDVDAILPARGLAAIETKDDFWQAVEQTNQRLAATGLFFTHLFEERQVILSPDWLARTVPIDGLGFTRLRLRRPATEDLILTKMMRVDPQDRDDIRFLMRQPDFDADRFSAILAAAVVPPVPEIQEAFTANAAWLRSQPPPPNPPNP